MNKNITMFSKPMIYQKKVRHEVIACGIYNNHKYYIISYGLHPCAYIEVPKYSKFYNKTYIDLEEAEIFIECHGGLTYSKNYLKYIDESEDKWFIGWDYAHCFDYMGYYEDSTIYDSTNGKKWTTEEIIKEIIEVIDQIVKEEYKED